MAGTVASNIGPLSLPVSCSWDKTAAFTMKAGFGGAMRLQRSPSRPVSMICLRHCPHYGCQKTALLGTWSRSAGRIGKTSLPASGVSSIRHWGRPTGLPALRCSLKGNGGFSDDNDRPEKLDVSAEKKIQEARAEAPAILKDIGEEVNDLKDEFGEWRRQGRWKDPEAWDWRWLAAGALGLAVLHTMFRSALGVAARPPWSPLFAKQRTAEMDTYMDVVVPEPTEQNLKLVKRQAWKDKFPEGYQVQRLQKGEDGVLRPVETGYTEADADQELGDQVWEAPAGVVVDEPVAVVEGVQLMSIEVGVEEGLRAVEEGRAAAQELDSVPSVGVKGGQLTKQLEEAVKVRFASLLEARLGFAMEHPAELRVKLKGGEVVTLRDADKIEAYRDGQTLLATTEDGRDVIVFNSPREAGVRNLERAKYRNQAALQVLTEATNQELRLAAQVASALREKANAGQVAEAEEVWRQWQGWVTHADLSAPGVRLGNPELQAEWESVGRSLAQVEKDSGPILQELKEALRVRVEVLERALPRGEKEIAEMEERIAAVEVHTSGATLVGLRLELQEMKGRQAEDAVAKQHLQEMLEANTVHEVVDIALREAAAIEALAPKPAAQLESLKEQLQGFVQQYSGRGKAAGPKAAPKVVEAPLPTTAEGWEQKASEVEGASAELREKVAGDLTKASEKLVGWRRAADLLLKEWSQLDLQEPAWQTRLRKWNWLLARDRVADAREALRSEHVAVFDVDKLRDEAVQEGEAANAAPAPALAEHVRRTWWKYRPEMPYMDFLRYVADMEVESAVFNQDFNKLYVTMKEGFPSEFVVSAPADPYLPTYMAASQVQVDTIPWTFWSSAWRVNAWFARVFGAILIVYAAIKAFPILAGIDPIQTGFTRPWPMLDPFRGPYRDFLKESLKKPEETMGIPMTAQTDLRIMQRWKKRLRSGKEKTRMDIQFTDIGGMTPIIDGLYEVLEMYSDPAKYMSQGATLPRCILLSGPPGTGKTMLARALANECQMPFFFVAGSDFVEMIGGNKEKSKGRGPGWRMNDLFMAARMNAPAVIFIDEIDALAADVKDPAQTMHKEPKKDVMSVFFEELEGTWYEWHKDHLCEQILVIMATNRPTALMPQMRRPDFLDREIHIPLPDAATRCEIFNIHRKDKQMGPDVDFFKLVHRTVGWNGADIRNLINEAGILAIRKGRTVIVQADLVGVLDKLVMEEMDFTFTEEEVEEAEDTIPRETKWMISLHHSAKVLLALLWPRYDILAATGVCTGKQLNSWSSWYPREELLLKGAPTVGYMKQQMVIELGARCAERLLLGDDKLTDATAEDLREVAALCRRLVESGASPRTGLYPFTRSRMGRQSWRADPLQNIYQSGLSGPVVNMSVEVAELFTRDIDRYILECEEVAMEALRANKQILLDLTEEFMRHDKLSGDEVKAFIDARNPIRLPDWFVGIDIVNYTPGQFAEGLRQNLTEEMLDPNWRRFRYQNLDVYPAPLHRG